MAFALDYPAPGALVIISGDRDFAYAAATLRLRGFDISIISPDAVTHSTLKRQADHLFDWQKDVLRFVQVPDIPEAEVVLPNPTEIQRRMPKKSISYKPAKPQTCHTNGKAPKAMQIDTEEKSSSPDCVHLSSWDLLPTPHLDVCSDAAPLIPEASFLAEEQGPANVGDFHPSLAPDSDTEEDHAYLNLLAESYMERESQDSLSPDYDYLHGEKPLSNFECGSLMSADTKSPDSPEMACLPLNVADLDLPPLGNDFCAKTMIPEGLPSPIRTKSYSDDHQFDMAYPDAASMASYSSQGSQPRMATVLDASGWRFVADLDRHRFAPLISAFNTRSRPLKPDLEAYRRAGVFTYDEYLEAARAAGIIISPPSLDGTVLVELNPALVTTEDGRTEPSNFVTPPHPMAVTEGNPEIPAFTQTSELDTYDKDMYAPSGASESSGCSSSTSGLDSLHQPFSKSAPNPVQAVTEMDCQRFATLIDVFNKDLRPLNKTKALSSEVAFALRKHDPLVFERAGVSRFKEYAEAARAANIIFDPELDSKGYALWEMNPSLYWYQTAGVSPPTPTNNCAASWGQPEGIDTPRLQLAKPFVDPVFCPLIDLLRDPRSGERMLMSKIGSTLLKTQGDLYRRASVSRLSEYLAKAVYHGIIETGTKGPGREWVQLKPCYRS